MNEYTYNIYDIRADRTCIHSNLSKEEFDEIWKTLDLSGTFFEMEKVAVEDSNSPN
jgi:hypothetical protein